MDEAARAALHAGEVGGVIVVSPKLITKYPSLILQLCLERRLPLASHRPEAVAHLFSYGQDFSALGRDDARYVDRLLKGARPEDLPVQRASRLELGVAAAERWRLPW